MDPSTGRKRKQPDVGSGARGGSSRGKGTFGRRPDSATAVARQTVAALRDAAPRLISTGEFVSERAAALGTLQAALAAANSDLGHAVRVGDHADGSHAVADRALRGRLKAPSEAAADGRAPLLSIPLPRHLRRRTNSHKSFRMPQALRSKGSAAAAAAAAGGKAVPDEDRCRAHRRKPSLLRATIQSASAAIVAGAADSAAAPSTPAAARPLFRLPATHVWHAKRFHMGDPWALPPAAVPLDAALTLAHGYSAASTNATVAATSDAISFRLPLHRNDIGLKAAQRYAGSKAVAHDASYTAALLLTARAAAFDAPTGATGVAAGGSSGTAASPTASRSDAAAAAALLAVLERVLDPLVLHGDGAGGTHSVDSSADGDAEASGAEAAGGEGGDADDADVDEGGADDSKGSGGVAALLRLVSSASADAAAADGSPSASESASKLTKAQRARQRRAAAKRKFFESCADDAYAPVATAMLHRCDAFPAGPLCPVQLVRPAAAAASAGASAGAAGVASILVLVPGCTLPEAAQALREACAAATAPSDGHAACTVSVTPLPGLYTFSLAGPMAETAMRAVLSGGTPLLGSNPLLDSNGHASGALWPVLSQSDAAGASAIATAHVWRQPNSAASGSAGEALDDGADDDDADDASDHEHSGSGSGSSGLLAPHYALASVLRQDQCLQLVAAPSDAVAASTTATSAKSGNTSAVAWGALLASSFSGGSPTRSAALLAGKAESEKPMASAANEAADVDADDAGDDDNDPLSGGADFISFAPVSSASRKSSSKGSAASAGASGPQPPAAKRKRGLGPDDGSSSVVSGAASSLAATAVSGKTTVASSSRSSKGRRSASSAHDASAELPSFPYLVIRHPHRVSQAIRESLGPATAADAACAKSAALGDAILPALHAEAAVAAAATGATLCERVDIVVPRPAAHAVWMALVTAGQCAAVGLHEWIDLQRSLWATGPAAATAAALAVSHNQSAPGSSSAGAGAGVAAAQRQLQVGRSVLPSPRAAQAAVFPDDFPDTPAGARCAAARAVQLLRVEIARPWNKRAPFAALGAPAPLLPLWELLWPSVNTSSAAAAAASDYHDADAADAADDDDGEAAAATEGASNGHPLGLLQPLVVRRAAYAEGILAAAGDACQVHWAERSGSAVGSAGAADAACDVASAAALGCRLAVPSYLPLPLATPSPTLVPVRLHLLSRGVPDANWMVAVPSSADLTALQHVLASMLPAGSAAAAGALLQGKPGAVQLAPSAAVLAKGTAQLAPGSVTIELPSVVEPTHAGCILWERMAGLRRAVKPKTMLAAAAPAAATATSASESADAGAGAAVSAAAPMAVDDSSKARGSAAAAASAVPAPAAGTSSVPLVGAGAGPAPLVDSVHLAALQSFHKDALFPGLLASGVGAAAAIRAADGSATVAAGATGPAAAASAVTSEPVLSRQPAGFVCGGSLAYYGGSAACATALIRAEVAGALLPLRECPSAEAAADAFEAAGTASSRVAGKPAVLKAHAAAVAALEAVFAASCSNASSRASVASQLLLPFCTRLARDCGVRPRRGAVAAAASGAGSSSSSDASKTVRLPMALPAGCILLLRSPRSAQYAWAYATVDASE